MNGALWAAVAAALIAPSTGPASSQTFEEAVRANMAIALQLCIQNGSDIAAGTAAFRAAGFEYKPMAEVNGDTWHRFFAPAGTVRAEYLEGQMAPSCDVYSNHMSPAVAAPLVATILNQLSPGRYSQEPTPPGSCAAFADNSRPIPFVVLVGAVDRTDGCPALGSTVISAFSAV